MLTGLQLLAAYLWDRWIGDPSRLPHPVVGMGWLTFRTEQILRAVIARLARDRSPGKTVLRLLGCFLPLVVVGSAFGLTWLLIRWVESYTVWGARLLEVFLIASTIATKGLADAAKEIYQALASGEMDRARGKLGMVVGRDTDGLDEPEIVRGAVETVAENVVDAVTSPLFYAAIGGAPLAMAYRAVNTLDSMVGYRNERYIHLGWASARLDDAANWLPARLTLPSMLLALWICGHSPLRGWRVVRRDASKHPSPNSGISEAAMAGGLGIQLGGVNRYQGIPSHRSRLGDPVVPRNRKHILAAVRVMVITTWIYTGMLVLFCFYIAS